MKKDNTFRTFILRGLTALTGVVMVVLMAGTEKGSPIQLLYSEFSSVDSAASEMANACMVNAAFAKQGDHMIYKSADVKGTPPMLTNSFLERDVPPIRYILDPYPTFNGIAVDSTNGVVVMSDTNRKGLLIYDRLAEGESNAVETRPLRQIMGQQTQIGFIAGVALDPISREVFTVNNDVEDTMVVFSYDDNGNPKPKRLLYIPHQAWGLSLSRVRNEIAMSVQAFGVVIYRREAEQLEAPLRSLIGPNTGLADPHGIKLDDVNDEILVANHGNWNAHSREWRRADSDTAQLKASGGSFELPSITIYPITANGDVRPVRTIQGPQTQLNWPMQIDVDTVHDEIAVANNGDNSILIFRRTGNGDVAPVRIIRGQSTGLKLPVGVAIDTENDELWVANFGDHTALVFDRGASGNVAPKRIIRNAPAGTPTCGFGNPMAVAYDSKREEILVPN